MNTSEKKKVAKDIIAKKLAENKKARDLGLTIDVPAEESRKPRYIEKNIDFTRNGKIYFSVDTSAIYVEYLNAKYTGENVFPKKIIRDIEKKFSDLLDSGIPSALDTSEAPLKRPSKIVPAIRKALIRLKEIKGIENGLRKPEEITLSSNPDIDKRLKEFFDK